MALTRLPRKLVRPGQWVLAKITPYLREHSYTFDAVEKAFICVVPMLTPRYDCKHFFDWSYRVYWRYYREWGPDETPYYTHESEYCRREKDKDVAYMVRHYSPASTWDFGLIRYNSSECPGPYDEAEHARERDGKGGFLYEPASDDPDLCPGGDYSLYRCDKCGKNVIPWSNDEGELVCSGCEPLTGLIHDAETADQIDRARALADWVDSFADDLERSGCPVKGRDRSSRAWLERAINFLSCSHPYRVPNRSYLHREDKFSFYFVRQAFDEGKWKRDYNGGLIMHGPHVDPLPGGGYKFTTWDYGQKCERPSTPEEIAGIHWSTHT